MLGSKKTTFVRIIGDMCVSMVSYYESSIEPIEVMAANFSDEEYAGFLKGNILKYIIRAGKKGPAVDDYRKAEQYLRWLIEDATEDASDMASKPEPVVVKQAMSGTTYPKHYYCSKTGKIDEQYAIDNPGEGKSYNPDKPGKVVDLKEMGRCMEKWLKSRDDRSWA